MLQVYARISTTYTLGPGKRYAIWVQGCPFQCPGCLAPASIPFKGGESISISQLESEILSVPDLEGITLSGGEPFSQVSDLAQLAEFAQCSGLGVIVYTGYKLALLKKKEEKEIYSLLSNIDLLIDGLYVESKNDGLSLRGSSNQNLHFLTSRYKDVAPAYYELSTRKVEYHMEDDGIMLVGVPGRKALKKFTST